jgi:phosphoglycolate phosphatase
MKKLIIFDLDGTLLNTIGDIAASANYALKNCGFPPHETDAYRFMVGNGINDLLERALPENDRTAKNVQNIRAQFMQYYTVHSSDLTAPYPGITDLLLKLQALNIPMAVASNKYQQGTEALVKHYFPEINFAAVLGQREDVAVKPDPTIVENILAINKTDKADVLYVGDSGVDMQTANNAKVDVAGVSWGFRPVSELETYSPTYIIDQPSEVLRLI